MAQRPARKDNVQSEDSSRLQLALPVRALIGAVYKVRSWGNRSSVISDENDNGIINDSFVDQSVNQALEAFVERLYEGCW